VVAAMPGNEWALFNHDLHDTAVRFSA
jgi:hypothetical protein